MEEGTIFISAVFTFPLAQCGAEFSISIQQNLKNNINDLQHGTAKTSSSCLTPLSCQPAPPLNFLISLNGTAIVQVSLAKNLRHL